MSKAPEQIVSGPSTCTTYTTDDNPPRVYVFSDYLPVDVNGTWGTDASNRQINSGDYIPPQGVKPDDNILPSTFVASAKYNINTHVDAPVKFMDWMSGLSWILKPASGTLSTEGTPLKFIERVLMDPQADGIFTAMERHYPDKYKLLLTSLGRILIQQALDADWSADTLIKSFVSNTLKTDVSTVILGAFKKKYGWMVPAGKLAERSDIVTIRLDKDNKGEGEGEEEEAVQPIEPAKKVIPEDKIAIDELF